ncbi:hypothetical protein ASG52_13890 [Methylobacterium sp. Leaf456]|nr:hypothetical protein ASG52_13890 [Methylobacterium sp. Leaf456]
MITAIVIGGTAFGGPAFAQGGQDAPSVTPQQRESVSNEKAKQIRILIAEARKRQQAVDRRNTDLWVRWTYAVCIGCGPTPKSLRIVHTYPLRVLTGTPAAMDDARERRGLRV